MWRGTRILGNKTRLGRGKSAISIKSYEEFFVLTSLIDRAASSSEKERTKTTAQAFRQCRDFAGRPHYRILNDRGRLIDPADDVLGNAIKAGKRDTQGLT